MAGFVGAAAAVGGAGGHLAGFLTLEIARIIAIALGAYAGHLFAAPVEYVDLLALARAGANGDAERPGPAAGVCGDLVVTGKRKDAAP